MPGLYSEPEDDQKLVDDVLANDADAGRVLYGRYNKAIWSVAYRLGRHEPDEYHDEMWFHVFCSLHRFDATRARLKTFVMVVATNKALEMLRKRLTRLAEQYPEKLEVPAPGVDPGMARDIRTCFEQLGPECQELLMLKAEGIKSGQISEILDVSPPIVYVRLNRCRARMRNCLGIRAHQKGVAK